MVTEVVAPARPAAGARVALIRSLPTGAVVVTASVLAWQEQGSLRSPDWLPAAVVVALILAVALAAGVAVRPARAALLGLAALLALAVDVACSIAWSSSPSGARDEALLTAFYAATTAVPLVTIRTPHERLLALRIVIVSLAIVGVATCVSLIDAHDPLALYFGGRLDRPLTYPNATALLVALGIWPALAVAGRRLESVAIRAVAGGAAALFLALTLAAQSKGALLGLVVSALVTFAFVPYRLRLFVPAALVAAIGAAAFTPLTAPYRATTDAAAGAAIQHVGWVALLAAAVGTVATVVYAVADRRVDFTPAVRKRSGVALGAVFAAAVLAGAALFVAHVHHPGAFFSQKWQAFKHPATAATGSSHLLSLGSARYDIWRVALHDFSTRPVAGIGARGYYGSYLREGRTAETPLRAHSLYFDTLAEDGLIGAALLALALGPLVLLLWRRRSRLTVAATLAGAVVFLVHAGVDWMWTVPPVGMFFFVLVGIGASASDDAPLSLPMRAAIPVAVVAVLVAAFAFAPPWVADRYVQAAYKSPASAAADLRWAHRLDPLSLDPYFARWRLAGSRAEQIAALEDARRLEPDNVAAAYQLGLTELAAGDKAAARRALLDAHRLDPRDRLIASALRRAG